MLTRRQPLGRWALRPAVPDDAAALARLCEAHAAFERLPYRAEGHAERLADALAGGRLRAWLGRVNGVAVGYASATLDFATLSARPFMHLDCLYLDAALRGRGLGGELMGAVADTARALGCVELEWQTPVWNEGAVRFYDRLGAARLDKRRYTLSLR